MKIPTICRYCGGKIIKSTTRALYPKGSEPIYLCVNCNRRPAFDPPLPQTWERNYWLERYQTPQAVENHLQKNGLLKENSHE